jgi:ribonuclease BN (tRNA processing enzyme)
LPKIIFLGTNGWYDSETGNTISILVQTEHYDIVLDAGYGIWKLGQYANGEKPVYLFISHFHIDHIAGMHTIALNTFSKGLSILIQDGGTELLNRIIRLPYTIPLEDLPFETTILEVPQRREDLPFKAEFLPMLHPVFTLGVRLEVDGKVITYCPDTGYCGNALKLALNADLLIADCAYKPNEVDVAWPHLNPEMAARIANEANVKKLVLTHFDAKRYETIRHRQEAENKAKETFENSYLTTDGMILEL